MKKLKSAGPSAGSRILASLQEAVDWVEGQDVAVRVTTVDVAFAHPAWPTSLI